MRKISDTKMKWDKILSQKKKMQRISKLQMRRKKWQFFFDLLPMAFNVIFRLLVAFRIGQVSKAMFPPLASAENNFQAIMLCLKISYWRFSLSTNSYLSFVY